MNSCFKALCLVFLLFILEAFARPRPSIRHYRPPFQKLMAEKNGKTMKERLLKGSGCTTSPPRSIQAPKTNPWRELSELEHNNVAGWVYNRTEFNLTHTFADWHNTIWSIELMQPNKSDVIHYLDGHASPPLRYAHVVLSIAATANPVLKDILVGPLPISNRTTWQPLYWPFTRKTPIRSLYFGLNGNEELDAWDDNITSSISDITLELWNATALGKSNDTIYAAQGQFPPWQYDNRVTVWSQFWSDPSNPAFDSSDLLPLGLYYGSEFDLHARDPSSWKFKGWVYNNIFYATTEDFRKAVFSPGFEMLGKNEDGPWTWTDQTGPVFPLDVEAPPMPIAGRTARFSVDWDEKYVEWMGFSFYVRFNPSTGMALHDIRFKGERIIYELGLQEALAHYAGVDPLQSGTSYLDASIGFGQAAVELMPGYDCPTYASFLNVSYTGVPSMNGVCLFEFDADFPIQRHAYSSNTKNIYFVIRTVNTVGNYDYMVSYKFYMDASIEIEVRAAGYIQSSFYAHNEDYGYKIHDYLSGGMHDHVINFKADIDILGTSNTLELVTVKPTTENYIWSDQPRNTMKIVREQIGSEDDSKLMWAKNGATQYRIVNTDEKNKYGEYRGYRIFPSQGTIHLAVQNSSNLADAANWAKYDLAVTKQKDTEPKSANQNNDEDVYNPMVDFDKFFDGENLQQEDLVLWFNLGMHHLPHTGDIPNTVFTTAHSAVQIAPSNYFTRDQSRDTVNMVRLDIGMNYTSVHTFGQHHQVCQANLTTFSYS